MSTASLIYLGILGIGILLLILYHKSGKLLKCLVFTAISGLGALGIVFVFGQWIAIPIVATPLSLLIAGVLGIPGVVSMLLAPLL